MPRPKYEHPTPAELEVLKILWDQGPSTVRQVMEVLNRQRRRAYTSVMSLLGVMTDKGLLKRGSRGRRIRVRGPRGPRKNPGPNAPRLAGPGVRGLGHRAGGPSAGRVEPLAAGIGGNSPHH